MIILFREGTSLIHPINVIVGVVDEYKTYFKHNWENILNDYSKMDLGLCFHFLSSVVTMTLQYTTTTAE